MRRPYLSISNAIGVVMRMALSLFVIGMSVSPASASMTGLIDRVLNSSSSSIEEILNLLNFGQRIHPSPLNGIRWCTGTYYSIQEKFICLDQNFLSDLRVSYGDVGPAFVVAHEYAHHVCMVDDEICKGNGAKSVTRLELTADCMAGFFLGEMPEFKESDLELIIAVASKLGDHEYDDLDHHGLGELRALAVRSGWRGSPLRGGRQDNYSSVLCNPS